MTERLNTLEAKVRTCLCSSVWQTFPRVAGEKEAELAALDEASVLPSTARNRLCCADVHTGIARLALPMQPQLCLPSSLQPPSSAPPK